MKRNHWAGAVSTEIELLGLDPETKGTPKLVLAGEYKAEYEPQTREEPGGTELDWSNVRLELVGAKEPPLDNLWDKYVAGELASWIIELVDSAWDSLERKAANGEGASVPEPDID